MSITLLRALNIKWPIVKYSLRWKTGWGPRVVVSTAAFHARVRGSVPGLGGLKETKNVSSPSTCESQYCGEPPWPRGSVLGLRPPGLEFRILCLEDSVISIISPSSGGFSWPSLAYMCTKVASSPIHFIYDLGQKRNTFKYQKILISQVWSTRKHTNHNVKLPCFIVKYTKYTLKMRSIRCMTTYWNSPHYICQRS